VCWTRDSRGFFYARPFRGEDAGASSAREGLRGCYHRLGDAQSKDRQLIEWGHEAGWAYFMTSEDGHYAALVTEEGTRNQIFMLDLTRRESAPVKILAGRDAIHTPIEWVGSRFFIRSELDAPRRRVIVVDLDQDAAAAPREIVPESSDVITDAIITADRIVINYLSDVHGRLRIFTLDGKPEGDVGLPGIGAVGWPLSARPSTPELFYSYQSFLSPPAVYSCDVRTRKATVFRGSTGIADAARYQTKHLFYPSKDGTRVPMFVTTAKDIVLDGSHPVFLTAYGGYGSTMEPYYSPDVPLWLEMGGVYVLANIRGGGEYGEEWHRAGMLAKKQTSFDDFIAAAEYLIEAKYTQRGKIAIYGHSNGGLLIGAVLTQRPDLFGAAVANAGHYDMLRYHRFTAGSAWVSEYGSADDPAQFEYLRAYSPLHNVKDSACYPATLLLAADHDDRVVPSHSYKFAAALQAAQRCDAPILLRVAKNASHSYSSRAEVIAERADMWTFIAANLGVSP
jgi:prolyl oligopeptidase